MNTKGLVDSRNKDLWDLINKEYTCSIEYITDTQEYGCFTKNNTAILYVPKSSINPDSFTHELLHIYIRMKQVFIGSSLKSNITSNPRLNKFYSLPLIEHIGNCLDHIKMLPLYLAMGYKRELFIQDYNLTKCSNEEIQNLQNYFQFGPSYNGSAIDLFIGKIFAIRACPNNEIDYRSKLIALKKINSALFEINQNLIDDWIQLDIDVNDPLELGYIGLVLDYCDRMNEWCTGKIII